MELSQSIHFSTAEMETWTWSVDFRLFIYQDLLEMHNPACKQMASQSPRVSKGIQVKLLNLNKHKRTERPSPTQLPKVTDSVSFTRCCTLWIPRCFIPRWLQVAYMNKYQPSDGTTHNLFSFLLRLPQAPPAIGAPWTDRASNSWGSNTPGPSANSM